METNGKKTRKTGWAVWLAVLLICLALGLGVGLAGCKDQSSSAEPSPAAAGQLYTCPMHPQIVEKSPGKCPICGMDLVPMKKQDATGQPPGKDNQAGE